MKNRVMYTGTSGSIDVHVDCNSVLYEYEGVSYQTSQINNVYTLRVVIEHNAPGKVSVAHTIPGIQHEVYPNVIVLFVYFGTPVVLNDAYIAKIEYTNNGQFVTKGDDTGYGCVITSLSEGTVTEHKDLGLNGFISSIN